MKYPTNYEYLREALERELLDREPTDKNIQDAIDKGFEGLGDDYLAALIGYDDFFSFVYQYSKDRAINPTDWLR